MQLPRFAWLWAISVVLAPATAAAYEIKTSSSGAPVHWAVPEVAFVPALMPGPTSVATADAMTVLATSAATWRAALVDSEVSVIEAATTATPANHINDGVNTVRWAMGQTDPDIERGVLALTFVAYRASDGVVSDADVILNAADFAWTTSSTGCVDSYDLESALTHELGHALGLAHSADRDATMFATGDACEITKRDLSSDDLAGIAELYPPPAAGPMGDDGGGCSTRGGGGLAVVLAAAVLVGRGRRRWGAVALALAIGAPAAEASQLRRLALSELGRDAVLVVRGNVVAVSPERGGAIETASEIVVDECLRGDCPSNVRVIRRGGERDGVGLWVDGEAAPVVGAEVVVYLRRDPQGRLRVLGGVQGVLRVIATPLGRFALRDLRGHHVLADGAWSGGGLEAIRLANLRRR